MSSEKDRQAWAQEFSERGRDSGSILDSVRITPPTERIPQLCSPGWVYTPGKGTLHRMNCKRRTCFDCGWFWAWRWRQALARKAENDLDLHKRKADKALTLTFAENVPYLLMQRILEWFWESLRRAYPGVEYWGAVEFNQSHTIPHLHFILANAPYLELDYLDYCWKSAQRRAKLEHLAWNLRIEKIKKNTQAYFTKYVTKLLGGKDEIPRRENWKGRFVRYSRGFFPIPVNAMLAGVKLTEKLKANDALDRVYWRVRQPGQGLGTFIIDSKKTDRQIDQILKGEWSPIGDKSRGSPLPADDLLTGVGFIPVFHVKQIDRDRYQSNEGYNYVAKTGRYGPAF